MQVFYSSPWVPPEWIKAHGLEPRGGWYSGDLTPLPLAAGVCAFAEAVVRLAETHPGSGMIFSTHCDQLRRGFDVVAGASHGRAFLFNLPATWQTGIAERIFACELERLGRFLVGLGGQPPTAEALAEMMAQYRQARGRLLKAAAHFLLASIARRSLDSTGMARSTCGKMCGRREPMPFRWPSSAARCRRGKGMCWMPSKAPAGAWC